MSRILFFIIHKFRFEWSGFQYLWTSFTMFPYTVYTVNFAMILFSFTSQSLLHHKLLNMQKLYPSLLFSLRNFSNRNDGLTQIKNVTHFPIFEIFCETQKKPWIDGIHLVLLHLSSWFLWSLDIDGDKEICKLTTVPLSWKFFFDIDNTGSSCTY